MAQPQPVKAASGEEPKRPNPKEQVTVWPHLLLIEFVGALIYTIGLSILAILIKAPLLDLANPTHTPNPAKAPWYFLNLQELLLHMHPSLAGVIVPGLVLVLIAAIPYIDTDPSDTGVWFSGEKGLRIFKFSFVYTALIVVGLVLFDAVFAVNVGGVDSIGTRGVVAAVLQLFMSPEAIRAQAQLDVVLQPPVRGVHGQLVDRRLAAQEILGQRGPVVGRVLLVADDQRRAVAALLAVLLGHHPAGEPAADDHVLEACHHGSPYSQRKVRSDSAASTAVTPQSTPNSGSTLMKPWSRTMVSRSPFAR